MSERQRKAIRPLIDQMTADYVDAAVASVFSRHMHEHHPQASPIDDAKADADRNDRLRSLANSLAQHQADIERLKTRSEADDRYSLTRAKLIRALKTLGIN